MTGPLMYMEGNFCSFVESWWQYKALFTGLQGRKLNYEPEDSLWPEGAAPGGGVLNPEKDG